MDDREAIEVMQRSASEIRSLRAEIERLRPLADAYESIRTVLGLLPGPSQGVGIDLAWQLERHAEALKMAIAEAEAQKPVAAAD